jgi:hypothetical protein
VEEAMAMSGLIDLEDNASFLLDQGLQSVILTLGPKGAMYRDSKGRKTDIPAFDMSVVCTCGLGDCFNGGFANGLHLGRSLEECIRLGKASSAQNAPGLGSQAGVTFLVTTPNFMEKTPTKDYKKREQMNWPDMQRTPPFPFLPDLEMPLRDAMRGVAIFSEAAEGALEPAARLLPKPLREGFQMAIRSVKLTGKQSIDNQVQQDQILMAAGFATGNTDDVAAAKCFAKVICFAWDHLQGRAKAPRHLMSETIVASKTAQAHSNGSASGAAFATDLIGKIRKSPAIGRMPGFIGGIRPDEKNEIDMELVAIMVWLLSARPPSFAEEVPLLYLAAALISALQCDVAAALDDPAKLADILQSTSAHL